MFNHPTHDLPHKDFLKLILKKTSRTFALNIPLLRKDLYWSVLISYLICRILDTVEDCENLSSESKKRLFSEFKSLLQEESRHKEALWKRSFFILKPKASSSDITLVENLERVLESYWSLPPEYRSATKEPILKMAEGMGEFTAVLSESKLLKNPYPIKDQGHLERYCYFVAGTVGELLTACFCVNSSTLRARYPELSLRAANFGRSLQLVNIVKDYRKDLTRGDCFIPESFLTEKHTMESAILGKVLPMFQREAFISLEYIHRINLREVGVRLFCLWPLWLAVVSSEKVATVLSTGCPPRDQSIKISRWRLFSTLIWVTCLSWNKRLLQWDFKRRMVRVDKMRTISMRG